MGKQYGFIAKSRKDDFHTFICYAIVMRRLTKREKMQLSDTLSHIKINDDMDKLHRENWIVEAVIITLKKWSQ